MDQLPFYFVTLTHPGWEEAKACAAALPAEALPELRLDLFPQLDPAEAVAALKGRCLVSCRRRDEHGRWDGTEQERLAHLRRALEGRPRWLDLEWELAVPEGFRLALARTRLLRSVHVAGGTFDLPERLQALPEGDAYKWVGVAGTLADNARLRAPLAWARDHNLALSAFLMGAKGVASRALQGAWGGSFTYAAPDEGPPAVPGQVPLAALRAWRCHRIHPDEGLCGVLGAPVLHSKGPAFHNARFQRAFKSLLYLPLECADADEAIEALEALEVVGASITAPLKEALPARLGLRGPLNTIWRRRPGVPWSGANTDAAALAGLCAGLPRGPVLVLGRGGVARTTKQYFEGRGMPLLGIDRSSPVPPGEVAAFAPVGVVQATSLGMEPDDPAPFPAALEAAAPTLRWAVEWIYKADTAFTRWARSRRLDLVEGASLFDAQAEAQSRIFVQGCGE